ncbi:MAG: 50S ribosomal protein L35ae [Sulfolobales archaeon]|nr:50S ribosomal protein L35ae [Sulfolobales archaeon]
MSDVTELKALGIVLGYRRGSSRQYVDQVYIKVLLASTTPTHSLIGRKVRLADGYGNVYLGKIVRVHGSGKNGVVIAVFNRNIPGQLIGAEAIIF